MRNLLIEPYRRTTRWRDKASRSPITILAVANTGSGRRRRHGHPDDRWSRAAGIAAGECVDTLYDQFGGWAGFPVEVVAVVCENLSVSVRRF